MDFLDWILDPKTLGKLEKVVKAMEDKAPNTSEMCIAPGVRHNIEFKIAAFGQQTFQCTLCGLYFDVVEDSQP